VKPTLGPMMINGWGTGLSPRVQSRLARWAVKTAVILDQLGPPPRVVPASENHAFYAAKQPLRTHLVVIAHRSTTERDKAGRELLAGSIKETVSQFRVD